MKKLITIILVIIHTACTTKFSNTQFISKERAFRAQQSLERLSGTFQVSTEPEEVILPWAFSMTTKGNGVIEIGKVGIRIYDDHDDSTWFKGFLLNNHFEDINLDGYLDLVLSGNVIKTDEKNDEIIDSYELNTIFFYIPSEKTFKQGKPHPDILVYNL